MEKILSQFTKEEQDTIIKFCFLYNDYIQNLDFTIDIPLCDNCTAPICSIRPIRQKEHIEELKKIEYLKTFFENEFNIKIKEGK